MKDKLTRNRTAILLAVTVGLIFSLLLLARPAAATPSSGLTADPIARGELFEEVRAKFKDVDDSFGQDTAVKSITTIKFTLAPGGTFGWHQHGGPVWAVITAGELTIYRGDDPDCTPQVYPAGSAFLDPGNDIHIGVNETGSSVEVYATFMLPEGGLPRLDAEDPGVCS